MPLVSSAPYRPARASVANTSDGGDLVVEDAEQPLGEHRVSSDAPWISWNQQRRRPRSTHLVSEPVHLPGVAITPAPPIAKHPIGGNPAAQGSLDHGPELDGLSRYQRCPGRAKGP